MLGGNLGSLLYGDVSVMHYDPLAIIYPTKKETHHLELINSHEGNKWCALYISAKVEFY